MPNLFVGATFATSVQKAIQRCRTVINRVPIPKSAFGVILTFLTTICLCWDKKKMVYIVISFQWTFGSSDHPRGTLFQVVTKQRLFVIIGFNILVITTINIIRTRFFTFVCITNKCFHIHTIFPGKKRVEMSISTFFSSKDIADIRYLGTYQIYKVKLIFESWFGLLKAIVWITFFDHF